MDCATSNMSLWISVAASQVNWRLMVASTAKISRPLTCAKVGVCVATFRNAVISLDDERLTGKLAMFPPITGILVFGGEIPSLSGQRHRLAEGLWQAESVHQLAHLLPRGERGHGERDAQSLLRQVQHGETHREELAEDHPFAKAFGHPKADTLSQCRDRLGQPLLVARLVGGDAVAHHHPVERRLLRHQAALAAIPDE